MIYFLTYIVGFISAFVFIVLFGTWHDGYQAKKLQKTKEKGRLNSKEHQDFHGI